jgi:hypothetical protein
VNEKLIDEINNEKRLLEEQRKLLNILKERIDIEQKDKNINEPVATNKIKDDNILNDTHKLIDTIDEKNKELQIIVDEINIKVNETQLQQNINATTTISTTTTMTTITTITTTTTTTITTTTTTTTTKTSITEIIKKDKDKDESRVEKIY